MRDPSVCLFVNKGQLNAPKIVNTETVVIPGESGIIGQAVKQYPRMSEADAIELTNGSTLVAWTRKERGDDFSRGEIVGGVLSDQSLSFKEPVRLIMAPWNDVTDICGVNLCRLAGEIRLIFLGRNRVPAGIDAGLASTSLFQSVSLDEGNSWSAPARINCPQGYSILNNARVTRLASGRIIVPLAFVGEDIFRNYDQQTVFCLISDDAGVSWVTSSILSHPEGPLMEPDIIECSDGTLYMTIRTKFGCLYEARSYNGGSEWVEMRPSELVSSEAPSTLFRRPNSEVLWMFWCDHPYTGRWYERYSVAVAVSFNHGKTWRRVGRLEDDKERSFGYVSAHLAGSELLLTYYDWPLDRSKEAGGHFNMTSLRGRRIPLHWLDQQEMRAGEDNL